MFYIVPKVQKELIKYRLVVSCIDSFNAVFSKWLDFQMKRLLHCIHMYLKGSNDLIQDLLELPKLPPSTRLFTANATAMYTNIDTGAGLEAFTFLLDHYKKEILERLPESILSRSS